MPDSDLRSHGETAQRAAELRRQQLCKLGEPVPDSSLALFREAFDKFYPGRERALVNLYGGLRKAGLS